MDRSSRAGMLPYVVPFGIFIAGLVLTSAVRGVAGDSDALLMQRPEYWVYPLQTLACGVALAWYWKHYEFRFGRGLALAAVGGIVALVIWIAPQVFFGVEPRTEGFDPSPFEEAPGLYWLTVIARFARLVIIVPLVEEIFWRSFLMRYLINEDFQKVSFGTYAPLSFFGVAVAFMLVHSMPDYPAAFLTGLIFNGLAVRTKSLGACVIAHAITNLLLGFYIMSTRQWGFW